MSYLSPWGKLRALACALAIFLPLPTIAANSSTELVRSAPEGAPNVVIVLLDDVGFGAAATFGGPATTPALSKLAADGLSYNRFHTTGICSPTRAALLSGRNAHATGVGTVMNVADERPGYNGFHPKDSATIAEILRQNGYATAAFGKWHQTPDWEVSPAGPFDRWPTGEGFEKFYGFQGGETDQYEPTLFDGTTPIQRPAGDDYHLTTDLVNQSIKWIDQQKSIAPQKPFLLYLSTGATHAPIQVPKAYIDRYRGQFDQGWDKLREQIFARQKQLGVIPADTLLTPRPAGLPAWDSLSPEQQQFSSRLMEAYVAFLTHTDEEVGRLSAHLKQRGLFENTLFIYIVGDNGASAEGGLSGSLNYMGQLQGVPEPESKKFAEVDRLNGHDAYAHVNAAWAWAVNAPFQWTKTVASHLGGIRNPLVITWPAKIAAKGELRSQFSHVNDIAPTILEAAGIAAPKVVNCIAQKPMNGVSLLYSFDNATAAEQHTTQYFEVFGHRAIYHEGWMASAMHTRLPWATGFEMIKRDFEDDVWELYDLRHDFSQAENLADKHPEKLAELKAVFMREAQANQVLPLQEQNFFPNLPKLNKGVTRAVYHEGALAIPEHALPNMMNKSWTISASLESNKHTQGVLVSVGGAAGGWSLFINDKQQPVFSYIAFEAKKVQLVGPTLADGKHELTVQFDYAGGGYAKGGKLTLLVDGKAAASDTLPATPVAFFSINETFDVGVDTGTAAGNYPKNAAIGYPFTNGHIEQVAIEIVPPVLPK